MSERNTVVRALHDIGAAAWFGGSLMGAIGLNGAASSVQDPRDRARVAAAGWAKWTPVNAVAIGAHVIGGAGILLANRDRARNQQGVTANTTIKLAVTGAALAVTAYSGIMGAKTTEAEGAPVDSATDPSSRTPSDAAAAQRTLSYLQWAIPVLTGTIVVLGAQQGEQQRPSQILQGVAGKIAARTNK